MCCVMRSGTRFGIIQMWNSTAQFLVWRDLWIWLLGGHLWEIGERGSCNMRHSVHNSSNIGHLDCMFHMNIERWWLVWKLWKNSSLWWNWDRLCGIYGLYYLWWTICGDGEREGIWGLFVWGGGGGERRVRRIVCFWLSGFWGGNTGLRGQQKSDRRLPSIPGVVARIICRVYGEGPV